MEQFGTKTNGLRQIGNALKLVSTESIVAAASARNLTKEQVKQILIGKKLTKNEIEAALATSSYAAAQGTATIATGGFATALKGLGAVLKANPILIAIAGVSAAVIAFTQWQKKNNEAIREQQQVAKEAAQAYDEQTTSIESYKSKIIELRKELDSGNLSEQETYDKRKQLLEVQDEIVDKLGKEAASFDILKDSVDKVNSSLDNYSKKDADLLYTKNKDAFDTAISRMETSRNYGDYTQNTIANSAAIGLKENSEIYHQVEQIFKDVFGNNVSFKSSDDGRIYYELYIDPTSAKEGLDEVNHKIFELDKELSSKDIDLSNALGLGSFSTSWENAINGARSKAQEIIDEFGENYDTAIQLKVILDSNYSDIASQIKQYKEEYEKAVSDNNEAAAKDAYENMQSLIPEFEEIDDNGVRKYFSDLVQAFNEANKEYQFEIELKAKLADDTDTLGKAVKNAVKQFEKENGKVDIYAILNTELEYKNSSKENNRRASLTEEEQAYVALKYAADQYGMEVEELINLLVELGYVQSDNAEAAKNLEKPLLSLSETIETLADAEKKIGSLSSALGDFKENGFVTSEALSGLTETFGNLDSFEDFVKVLGNSKSSMKDAQKACNDLAKEFIDSTGILDNLNASNAGVIETFLKSIGVVNAREVVQARLNAVEYESMLAAEGLADAEWAVAERTLLAKVKSLEAVEAFKRLRQEQYNAKLAALDLNTATASTIGTLIQQAKAAGAAANSISALSTLQNIVQGGYAKYAGSGLTEKGYQALLENARRAAQIDLSDISNVTVPTVNVPTPKSSSTKKTKTAAEKLEEQLKELEDSFNNTLSGFEHQIFMLEKKGAAGISNAAISGLREALDYYNSELKDATEKGFDVSKTVYGNIDTNNRQILEWTDENLERFKSALESWGTTVDEMRGSISTVFGSSEEFDGIEIAFSPILQTKNGPVLLDSDTVREYIWSLIDNAGEGWTTEQLLKLDTQGLEFDGRIIKNLLADIGDTAIQTGEAMHYVGELGSIKQAYNELESLAKSASLSARELSQAVLDGDFGDSLTNKTKRTANRIVDIYEQMQAAVQKQEELYRSMGLDVNSKYIQNLQKQWWEYKESIKEVITESYEYIRKEHEDRKSTR